MSNHILIYGYGREGQSTESFLHAHHYPELISVYDEKLKKIELDWDDYDQIWLSPGIPTEKIPDAHRHKITSQADYFFSNLSETERQKVIAITGSKGKTTTTTALTHVLQSLGKKAECAGNIGTPLLEALPKLQHNELDYLVCEISSFQAERVQRSPHTVAFLNLFPDHLDRHGTEADYFQAKANLWSHQQSSDHFVVPETTLERVQNQHPGVIGASKLNPKLYPLSSVLGADHFRENLGVIPVIVEKLGIKCSPKKLAKIIDNTPLPDHRLQLVHETKGLKFYDDAIATNPTATIAAVKHFGKDLGVLILGGKSSEADPAPLIKTLEKTAPKAQIIVTSSNFAEELKAIETTLNIIEVPDLPAVFAQLQTTGYKLLAGSVVLLSPAAKSFDQYAGYPEKGKHFTQLAQGFES